MRRNDVTPAPDTDAPVSKTRRKKAMHDLQALGEALVALDRSRLATLDLPERLADAIAQARTVTKHEARRRQMQYVGRLMRDVDPAPIAATLAQWARGPRAEKAQFAAVEHWRDRLLADDAALDELLALHPGADRPRIAALVHDARREREAGGPPHRFRELFRRLKALGEPD
jgi:ribosome-associated protein